MDTDYHYSYIDIGGQGYLASPPILLFNENIHAGTAQTNTAIGKRRNEYTL